jgi:hypothetical protein
VCLAAPFWYLNNEDGADGEEKKSIGLCKWSCFLSITVVMVFLLDLESIQREELVFGPDDEADALRMYLWFSNTRNAFYISVYHRLTARGRT